MFQDLPNLIPTPEPRWYLTAGFVTSTITLAIALGLLITAGVTP